MRHPATCKCHGQLRVADVTEAKLWAAANQLPELEKRIFVLNIYQRTISEDAQESYIDVLVFIASWMHLTEAERREALSAGLLATRGE